MKYGANIIEQASGAQAPAPKKTFEIKKANKVLEDASARPVPKQLFGPLWFQGEMCIFFASSNVGKSILAVQIAESIARGKAIAPFDTTAHIPAQPVLYFDFELSEKQFENRYSENYQNHYRFSDNFYRACINKDYEAMSTEDMEKDIADGLEQAVQETGCRVVIIDNITWLKSDASGGKDAVGLMRIFTSLKRKYGLSFLVLGHTPKRDVSRPINQNDLQGSAALMQFCDSSFAAGSSMIAPEARYLKQIKVREAAFDYGADNTLVYKICKQDGNFLGFHHEGYEHEREHLLESSATDDENLKQQIQATIEAHPGWSLRQIADSVSSPYRRVNHMKVKRLIDKIRQEQEQEAEKIIEEAAARVGDFPPSVRHDVKEEDLPF
jgi:hypothetical protein